MQVGRGEEEHDDEGKRTGERETEREKARGTEYLQIDPGHKSTLSLGSLLVNLRADCPSPAETRVRKGPLPSWMGPRAEVSAVQTSTLLIYCS
jgi:hypothetical protein